MNGKNVLGCHAAYNGEKTHPISGLPGATPAANNTVNPLKPLIRRMPLYLVCSTCRRKMSGLRS